MTVELKLEDAPKEGDKNTDPRKAKGTFTIQTASDHSIYIRNVSGISLDEFLAYINSQPILFKINSRKVINKLTIVNVEYDKSYQNTYPEAEI